MPARRRSLAGKLAEALAARSRARPKRGTLAAVIAGARKHVLTAAALAFFDLAAFQVSIPHAGAAPGLTAVCVSLLALDFAVTG